jgi:tricorn protease
MLARAALRFALAIGLSLGLSSASVAQTKLLRFPDIHGDKVVFTYGGDLWLPRDGRDRDSTHGTPGYRAVRQVFTGRKTIAFTGQYDGDEQVYVVPVTGGVPKQLTFYPARGRSPSGGLRQPGLRLDAGREAGAVPEPARWLDPGGETILHGERGGGSAVQLPMPTAGAGAFSPDGKQMAYSPLFRDFRSEKRYGGGQANRLWIFDLREDLQADLRRSRAERDPMWLEKTIYYNTDKTGTFNLWT